MVNELVLHFKVLTPLYLGGADMMADLRPPGFKGPLRMWYRVIDPNFYQCWDNHGFKEITREDHFFGGSRDNAGQGPFLIRIDSNPFATYKWDKAKVARHNKGKGPDTVNGLAYLGFPFGMVKKGEDDIKRTAIEPGHTFSIRCVIPPKYDETELRRVLLASWWCLGHLGGVGSRSRRGFGSLALEKWETTRNHWPEMDSLPLLSRSSSINQWQESIQTVLETMGAWFGYFKKDCLHPHLGDDFRLKLIPNHFSTEEWDKAMAHMGERMQRFRKTYDSDKQAIRNHLLALNKKGNKFLEHAPDKSAFGLPLTFRFKGFRQNLEFVPFDSEHNETEDRHGSLLHMRLTTINDRLHPLFVRLSGDVPGKTPFAAIRNSRRPLRGPLQNAMDLFLDQLQ